MYTSPVDAEEDLTACIVEAVATITQQPDIFEHSCQSLLHRQPCNEVSCHLFEHLFKFVQNTFFFFRIIQWIFLDF
jgi:hypothetical protein